MNPGTQSAGGAWPAYSATLLIAFDRWENGAANGTVWSYYFKNPCPFQSLDQMLFAMDTVMNDAGYPESWFQRRQLDDTPPRTPSTTTAPDRVPYYGPDDLACVLGQFCTVCVRVRCRQHGTIQGDLIADGQQTSFRSALELLYLLRHILDHHR